MNDEFGTLARVAERERYAHRLYRAPVTAEKTHRITVNLKTGERTVESVEPVVAPAKPIVVAVPAFRKPEMPRWNDTTDILNAVAEAYNITTFALTSKTNSWLVAHPRFAAALVMRERRGMIFARISRCLGWREHSAASDAVRRARELFVDDPEWAAKYRKALAALGFKA